MKLKIIIHSIALSLFIGSKVFAFGGVVSDPISYTYYVEQIRQATEAIETGRDTVENIAGLRGQVDNMTSQFTGNYQRVMGLVNAVGKLKKEASGLPSSVNIAGDNIKKMISDYEEYGEVDANLAKAFNDPRSPNYNPWITSHYRYNMKQLSAKNTIKRSNSLLQSQEERLNKLEELGNQIDQTENIKDATDLNNRLLAELIKGNSELLAIMSSIAEMMALERYQGIEEEQATEAIKKAEGMEKSSRKRSSFVQGILDASERKSGYRK